MEAVPPDRRLAGRYVLLEPVATGGMAEVWRGHDTVLARTVAVKILRQALAEDPEFAERFRREAVAAAGLSHPNIVSVFDTGMDQDRYFIVMEYVGASTVRHVLDSRGSVESHEAAAYILPVLSALSYAHAAGVIHRDVKPANILIGDDGRVKVTDFGIAKAAFARADLTTTGTVLGTVRYLSPEQVQGSQLDARSDVYSTGAVLYELLTGRPPFSAESDVATAMIRLTTDPLPPRAIRPTITRGVEAVVQRALARRPDDRFPSAQAMLGALERHVSPASLASSRGGGILPGAGAPVGRFEAADRSPELPGTALPADRPTARIAPRPALTFRSWMLVPVALVLVAAAVIAVGLAVGRLELGGPLGVRPAPAQSTTKSGGGTGAALHIVSVKDFDPQGDQSEHPGDTHKAIDGDPSTAWVTNHYKTALFGGLKDGVGLWLDLGNTSHVQSISIRSSVPGWKFELQAGTLSDLSGPLPAADGGNVFTMAGNVVTVDLKPVDAPGILIWITSLAPDHGRFAAAISEVTVSGAAG